MHNSEESWESFLDPAILRPRLITASIYIAAFEILKAAIIDRLRNFLSIGFDPYGPQNSPEYQSEVLAKNKSPLYASLEWLKQEHVINDADVAAFERVKELRNKLAHTLTAVLFDGLPVDIAERLGEMFSLLDKIERWWIVNVEIDTDLDEIDQAKVIPGPIVGLRLLLDVAPGSEEESKKYLDEFKRLNATRQLNSRKGTRKVPQP